MEQKLVENTTDSEVQVMWDGSQIYFKPGEKKAFVIGVAEAIVNEAQGLSLVGSEVSAVAEEAKVVSNEPTEAVDEPEYTATANKKGVMQYRKDGKLISKEAYESR